MAGVPDNVALLLFFLFWYVGNAFYNQYNTMALTGASSAGKVHKPAPRANHPRGAQGRVASTAGLR